MVKDFIHLLWTTRVWCARERGREEVVMNGIWIIFFCACVMNEWNAT